MTLTYREAGVDIAAADSLVARLAKVAPHIGGFAGLFPISEDQFLVASTDGVGTKLMLAIEADRLEGLGEDLVAMCVNDLVTNGAKPLFFLDYFATGKLDVPQAERVLHSIISACKAVHIPLLGGETAEMPGFYKPGHFDLAGFAVGLVHRWELIDGRNVRPGDKLVGIPSSGPHSNGFSLIRKILERTGRHLDEMFGDATLGDVLLAPTRLYVNDAAELTKRYAPKAMAHITGGGFSNINRVLPPGLTARVTYDWSIPAIFQALKAWGHVSDEDMKTTFNLGIGFVAVLSELEAEQVLIEHPDWIAVGTVEAAS